MRRGGEGRATVVRLNGDAPRRQQESYRAREWATEGKRKRRGTGRSGDALRCGPSGVARRTREDKTPAYSVVVAS